MNCKKCNSAIAPGTVFCPVCGSRIEENTPPSGNNFFRAPIESDVTLAQNAQASQTSQQDSQVSQQAPQTSQQVSQTAQQYSQVSQQAPQAPQTSDIPTDQQTVPPQQNIFFAEDGVAAPTETSDFTESFITEPAPKKKRSKLKISLITAAIIFVLAGAVLAAEYFGNFFGWFMTPEEELHVAIDKEIDTVASSIAADVNIVKNITNSTISANATITLGDRGKELLISELRRDMGSEAEQMVDWLNNVGCDVELTLTNNATIAADLSIKANSTGITKATAFLDLHTGKLYLAVPEINDTAVCIQLEDSSEMLQTYKQLQGILSIIPDETTTKDTIIKYAKIMTSEIKTVEESDDTLKVSGVSEDCTLYSTTVTATAVTDATKNLLTELKEDEILVGAISELETQTGKSGLYDEFAEEIDDGIEEINEDDLTEVVGDEFYLKFWLNDDDEIIGVEITDSDDTFEISYISARDDEDFASALFIITEDEETVEFESKGKIVDNYYSGNSTYFIDNKETISLKFTDVDVEKYNTGLFDGLITITPSDMNDEADGASIELNIRENSASSAEMTLSALQYDELLFALDIGFDISPAKSIYAPSDYTNIDPDNPYSASTWLLGCDFTVIADNLEYAGLPSQYVRQLRDALQQLYR